MTEEHLEKIIKISEEVKRYKDFLKSLNNSYVNQIIACDWSGEKWEAQFCYWRTSRS